MGKTVKITRSVKSKADLDKIRNRIIDATTTESGADVTRVVVGMGTCGLAAGGQQIYDTIERELKTQGIKNVELVSTGCVGICQFEPVVEVYSGGTRTTYVRLTPERAVRIVQQHLNGGNVLAEFTIGAAN